jgi:hypothetical protein
MEKLFKFILTLTILIGLVNDSYSQCADPPSSTPTLCLGNSLTDITISTSASDISDNGVPGANGLPPGVAANFPIPNTLYLSMYGGNYLSEKYADITLSNPDLNANGIAETPYVTDQVWVYDNRQNNPGLDNFPLIGASGNNGHWNNGQPLNPQFGMPDFWVNEPGYSNSDFPQNFPITLVGNPGQSVYFNTWDRYDDSWDGTIWKFTDKPTSDPTHQVVFTSRTPNGGDQTSGGSWDGNPGRLEATFELLWWNPQPLVSGYSHDANGTRLSGLGGGGSSPSTIITISGTPLASGVYNYSIPLIGCAGNATGTITVSPDNTAAAPSATPTLCNNTPLTDITIATTGATGIGAATGLPNGVSASWSANEITVTGTPSQIGTFNYSVPLTGGCGTVNATGTITVTQDNTAAAPSNTPTLCENTALTDITIATTGATGIGTVTGLPNGVTASWSADEVTVTGTPSQVGTFNYSVPLIGGCGIVNATGSITVTEDNIVSAPSSTPTLCVNTPLTDITIRTKNHIMVTNVGSPVEIPNLNLPKPQNMNFWPTVSTIDGDGPLVASDPAHAWIDIPNTNSNSANYDWMSGNNGAADHRYTFSFMMIHNSNNELLNIDWKRWSDVVGGDNFYIFELATNSGDNYKTPGVPGFYYVPSTDGFTLSGDNGGEQASGTRSTTAEYICLYYYKQSPYAGIGDDRTYIRIRAASNPQSATGIGTATGLPNGVSANWSGDEIIISGTPSEVGIFNYIIPLTGGCGSVNATGTITVTPDNTAAAPSTAPTLCENTALTDITIATTGATGIGAATGLPSGVTASWSADEVTVTGNPSQVGTFNYSVPLTGGCGTVNATGSITVVSIDDPGFNYNSLCYFSNASDPFAQNIMTSGGTFSSSGGITISNNSTGLIDLSNSLPGNYLITYTTGGTCPQSANANVLIANGNDCNTPTFTPLSDPVAQTVASYLGGNEYQITPSSGSVRGAVWCDQPLNLDYSFTIEAELNFGSKGVSGSNDQGADGISFVLHQNYQPSPVGGIGYAGFDPSIAVEFDTYYNSNIISPATVALDNDAPNSLTDDHMAVQLDGVREHSSVNNLLSPINLGDIEDGQYHNLVLHWDVSSTTLKIYFKNQLIGQVVRDIRNDFTGLVYWGFAASNGAAYNDHRFRYLNSSFWYGRNPTSLSDNINEWQGDVLSPAEIVTDPIDNTTPYTTASWFNPCNWSASFVPNYNTDVVIPQQSSYTNHPLVNYDLSVFINHSVLNLDMDADGDVDSDDQIQGKAFAKSLQLEGDALFFIKTDDGADIQVKD